MDFRTIIYITLFIFLVLFLAMHDPGGGGHSGKKDHDKKDKHGKDTHK